jgi:hypothetical protein
MSKKVIFVDIDGTICYYKNSDLKSSVPNSIDYNSAIPYFERIEKINKLFDEGNVIVYWTSRGSRSGINWFQLTLNQLNKWGVKYTELRLGKPHYDIYIDDKSINSDDYFTALIC